MALWQGCEPAEPTGCRCYSAGEQAVREAELARLIGAIQAELARLPRTRADRDGARERITAAFVRFGRSALDFEDRHLELLLGNGFSAIATNLARRARRFDPHVSMADILQASRNAWTACGLQVLAAREMQLSPSIFAYSMLYPYSDNYVDDVNVPAAAKLRFSDWFRRRLTGETPPATSATEEAISGLVAVIEEEFSRDRFPAVFGSLLAIHRAQERSIRLLVRDDEVDVLELSFDKGGSSVLADAWLAAGAPADELQAFAFEWGVLLQLGDDLQDVAEDRARGPRTVFTESEVLDGVTARTLAFGEKVLARLACLGSAETATLKELIRRSSRSLLIRAAGQASELYSSGFLERLEPFSPFRFSFLNDCRRRLGRQSGALARLFEAFLAGDDDEPAFPLLPASLMQHL